MSVRVFVILFEVLLVGMRVRVGLPVVAVFVLMINMIVIVQSVRVCMRHIPVRVLVSVRCGHLCSVSGSYRSGEAPHHMRNDWAPLIDITPLACRRVAQ